MNEEELDEHVNRYISELVDSGALSPSGITSDGEFLYSMNLDIMQETSPEFFAEAFKQTQLAVLSLQEKGLVEYIRDESSNDGVWALTVAGTFHYESIEQAVYGEAEKLYED